MGAVYEQILLGVVGCFSGIFGVFVDFIGYDWFLFCYIGINWHCYGVILCMTVTR